MKIDVTFLRSKVGRHIFVLFVCCAILPIAALAVLSFSHVTKELNALSKQRLHHASKAAANAILERLSSIEGEMKVVDAKYMAGSGHIIRSLPEELADHLKEKFRSLAIITDTGKLIHLLGRVEKIPELTREQVQHIQSGDTLIFIKTGLVPTPQIFMATAFGSREGRRGMLLGELNPRYLWTTSVENLIFPMTEVCILDESNHVLFSSLQGPLSFPEYVRVQMSSSALGQFEWGHGQKKYMASFWSVFLRGKFFAPKWTVVMSESKSNVLAPAANFKKIFPFIFLTSLLVVLLLSVVQIRKSMVPLEKLQEGTRRIAAKDFNSRVTIKSGDEFEELALSFNAMADRLGKQFHILTTMGEIDRAILSALNTEKIIDVVLTRMPDIFPCDEVSVTLLDSNTRKTGWTYAGSRGEGNERRVEAIKISAEEIEGIASHPESLWIQLDEGAPSYLAPLRWSRIKTCFVLPIILNEKLSGFIALGWRIRSVMESQEDFDRARQLADQMGVALSNAGLIAELNELNWGTLQALARAIDAKSAWTAGHSERTTRLALKIGQVLDLPQEKMDVLRRGGLLHDIGKLGVPGSVLNKEGRLTEGEERVMRKHVRLGARILEPISAFAEVITIVSQHHECFDGTGYPQGLAGEAIEIGARIFAVADSFDALTSDRPYRVALDRESAVEIITKGAGSQFDRRVVQAFLEVMAQEADLATPETPDRSLLNDQPGRTILTVSDEKAAQGEKSERG